MELQKVDLYKPLAADKVGPAPLALRVAVTPTANMLVGGTSSSSQRVETYVLLSALPQELQERVKLACQALLAGR